MHLTRITLEQFRNIALAELDFEGRQQFFLGANGQGKTNVLEAIGFITALRSFRTTESELLIQRDKDGAGLAYELEHEVMGETGVTIKLRPDGKEVTCDGEWITKFGDFLGRFPTVVFSSQDQQLVRGSPSARRRWLDLTLAAMDAGYLHVLQLYHRALVDRNRLLKQSASAAELESFEKPLASAAAQVVSKRIAAAKVLSGYVASAYASLATEAEPATMVYAAEEKQTHVTHWWDVFSKQRARDLVLKTTTSGPHRDDFDLFIAGHAARDYGSEGQQRSLALALRLAQVNYFHEKSGIQPIVLADDVLGELDPERRRRFWASIGESRQVIATGTSLPDAELGAWQVFRVENGTFHEMTTPGDSR